MRPHTVAPRQRAFVHGAIDDFHQCVSPPLLRRPPVRGAGALGERFDGHLEGGAAHAVEHARDVEHAAGLTDAQEALLPVLFHLVVEAVGIDEVEVGITLEIADHILERLQFIRHTNRLQNFVRQYKPCSVNLYSLQGRSRLPRPPAPTPVHSPSVNSAVPGRQTCLPHPLHRPFLSSVASVATPPCHTPVTVRPSPSFQRRPGSPDLPPTPLQRPYPEQPRLYPAALYPPCRPTYTSPARRTTSTASTRPLTHASSAPFRRSLPTPKPPRIAPRTPSCRRSGPGRAGAPTHLPKRGSTASPSTARSPTGAAPSCGRWAKCCAAWAAPPRPRTPRTRPPDPTC